MTTCVSEEQVRNKLETALSPTFVEVKDLSDGCGAKFNIVVVSEKFLGQSLLARQRMVYSALEEEMKSIHAITMKTYTDEQYTKISAKLAQST